MVARMHKGRRRSFAVTIVVFLVFATVALPGVVAGQQGVGGSFIVEEGETVDEVAAVGGAVIVHGTVTGDVSGAAGNVLITGTVEGDVNVATGNLRIAGDVHGDVAAGAGHVQFDEGSTVGGNVDVGAGQVRFDGDVGGDVRVGAETIQLGETAAIAGSLTYDGELVGNQDAVAGEITRDRTITPVAITETEPFLSPLFSLSAFLANLVLGAVLLVLVPRFSTAVAERVASEPVTTGVVGFGVLIGGPLVLLLFAITIIGIPIALAGAMVFLVLVWIGIVYGRFALGMWLLSPTVRERFGGTVEDPERVGGLDRRWVALVLGLLLGALFTVIPILGGLINFVLFLLGLGGLALGLYARVQRRRAGDTPATEDAIAG